MRTQLDEQEADLLRAIEARYDGETGGIRTDMNYLGSGIWSHRVYTGDDFQMATYSSSSVGGWLDALESIARQLCLDDLVSEDGPDADFLRDRQQDEEMRRDE